MPKLRKMLGRIDDPEIKALMCLIETQNHRTLTDWASAYAQRHYLPLFTARCTDERIPAAVHAVRAYLAGELPLKVTKAALADARKAAVEIADPAAQAAARAIATACAALTTPANALGFAFYGAAAFAYSSAGTDAAPQEHDRLAKQELSRVLASLQSAAVADEPHPAKINWNC